MDDTAVLMLLLSAFVLVYLLKMASELLSSPSVSWRFMFAAVFWPIATVASLVQSLSSKLKKKGGDEELP